MNRSGGVTMLAGLALAGVCGCTNNYGQFDFTGSAQKGAGSTQGAGGSAEAGVQSAGGSAEAGAQNVGGSAQGGTAGSAGGAAGAVGGSGGATSCGPGQMPCGGTCVATYDLHNCGGCNNDCSALGLECLGGVCGCSQNSQCGQGTYGINCRSGGTCDCGGQRCRQGETCVAQGTFLHCSCGGGAHCQFGQTCCQTPPGCFSLYDDRNNCGACGNVCPSGQNCVNGSCA